MKWVARAAATLVGASAVYDLLIVVICLVLHRWAWAAGVAAVVAAELLVIAVIWPEGDSDAA